MALSRVQATAQVRGSNVATLTIPFTTPPTVGNAIVVPVLMYHSPSIGTLPTCTDTKGNTYTVAVSQAQGAATALIFVCAKIVTAGAGFSVVLTPAATSYFEVNAIEVGNVGLGLTVDQTAQQTGTGLTPATPLTAPLTHPDVLAVSACVVLGNQTSITVESVTPPWTQEVENLSFTATIAGEADSRLLTSVLGTTQKCGWTNTNSFTWAAVIAVFAAVAATDARVTQAVTEAIRLPLLPASRVTQVGIEVLGATLSEGRVTQALVELLQPSPRPVAQITQALVELLGLPAPGAGRVTALSVELFRPSPSAAGRHTQSAVEVFWSQSARARATQLVVEVFLVPGPCLPGFFPVDDVPAGGSCPAAFLP